MLGCIQPMSSPMMNMILGFASAGAGVVIFSCATAGGTIPDWPKPKVTAAAKTVAVNAQLSSVLQLRFSVEGIWIGFMGTSCGVRFPRRRHSRPARGYDQSARKSVLVRPLEATV